MAETGTEQTGPKKKAPKRKKKSKAKTEDAPAVPEHPEEVLALAPIESGVSEVWAVEAAKGIENLLHVAEIFSSSGLVPKRYKGQKNDCAIVIAMALKYGADILGFMQNVYVVHGTPGMESKLAIALVNMSGVFKGPIQYKMSGKIGAQDRACVAWGVDAKSGDRCEMSCSIADATRAGWTKPVPFRDGKGSMPSKWTVMPEMMLRYRSAMNMIRVYHPEILFGMKTVAELEDIGPREVDAEVVSPHRDEIREAVSSATASTPRLASPPADEKPLSESIAESATPVAGAQQGGMNGQEPARRGTMSAAPAPNVAADGQMSLGAATAPKETLPPADETPKRDGRFAVLDAQEPTTDDEMRAERKAVVTLYSDLARQHGEELKPLSSTMTGTLKDECRRLIKAMDLLI